MLTTEPLSEQSGLICMGCKAGVGPGEDNLEGAVQSNNGGRGSPGISQIRVSLPLVPPCPGAQPGCGTSGRLPVAGGGLARPG